MDIPFTSRPGDPAHRQIRAFAWAAAGLVVCFSPILVKLGQFALKTEFDSYILLIPAIAAGMFWARWKKDNAYSEPRHAWAIALLAVGIAALGFYWFGRDNGGAWTANGLTPAALSFVFLLSGLAAWFLGRQMLSRVGFPLGFLICMVPLPASLTADLEYLLQHASASLASVGFQLSDLPIFRRDDLDFQLPGITLQVGPECSGIQSSVALFVVSLAAGYVFLRSPWKRALLSMAVIPLGILRNAVRIVTIGELCVHVGPEMINSYVHRKGGWIFFLVSLLPCLALLVWFARLERPRSEEKAQAKGVLCQS